MKIVIKSGPARSKSICSSVEVSVDGLDVSAHCGEIQFCASARGVPVIRLELFPSEIEIDAETARRLGLPCGIPHGATVEFS